MLTANALLRRLRAAPEPLKRRLRPALVRGVRLLRAMPGGALLLRLARRLAPGLHGWLRRRYAYYVDSAVAVPRLHGEGGAARLDADSRIALGWLCRAGDPRVN